MSSSRAPASRHAPPPQLSAVVPLCRDGLVQLPNRFYDLFFSSFLSFNRLVPSCPACRKAAVLEDALDGVQDSPMLSMSMSVEGVQNSRPPSTAGGGGGGGGGGSGDERGDGSVQRLESLRELLVAALHYHPDLPLGLCVKSKSACLPVCVLCVFPFSFRESLHSDGSESFALAWSYLKHEVLFFWEQAAVCRSARSG